MPEEDRGRVTRVDSEFADDDDDDDLEWQSSQPLKTADHTPCCGRARFLVVSHVFWTNSFSSPREGTNFVSAEYLQFVCRVFDLTFHGQFCRQHVNWLTPTTARPLLQ